MKTLGTILGFIAGALLDDFGTAVLGDIIGFVAGLLIQEQRRKSGGLAPAAEQALQERVAALELRLAVLETRLPAAQPETAPSMTAPLATFETGPATRATEPAPSVHEPVAPRPLIPDSGPVSEGAQRPMPEMIAASAQAQPESESPVRPPRPQPRIDPLWAFLTGGNAPVRIGVIVLFFEKNGAERQKEIRSDLRLAYWLRWTYADVQRLPEDVYEEAWAFVESELMPRQDT